jgi:hypothetical protein
MNFRNEEEYFYLFRLSEWERTAPPDGHKGELRNGRAQRNTQTARMGLLLKLIDDTSDKVFRKLERRTERRNGRSYISKDASWMEEPYELSRGWYFEGCMSLEDKKAILGDLPTLGLTSSSFAQCAQDLWRAHPCRNTGRRVVRPLKKSND